MNVRINCHFKSNTSHWRSLQIRLWFSVKSASSVFGPVRTEFPCDQQPCSHTAVHFTHDTNPLQTSYSFTPVSQCWFQYLCLCTSVNQLSKAFSTVTQADLLCSTSPAHTQITPVFCVTPEMNHVGERSYHTSQLCLSMSQHVTEMKPWLAQ